MGFNNRQLSKRPRRASTKLCDGCEAPVSLIDCGVDSHKFAERGTRRKPVQCNGRVYAHDDTGGMECPAGGPAR